MIAEPGSEGAAKPLQTLPTKRVDLPPGTRVRRGGNIIDDPPVSQMIVINIVDPEPTHPLHPCQLGQHRWAYLTAGGQACGYCGARRA